ncbi:MAG: amino acid ABC transporter substrate-binding protein [Flavobacteriales bacterium]
MLLIFWMIACSAFAQNIHEVQKGETLYALSKTYDLTIASILESNPQAEYGLKEGMKILIPDDILRENETLAGGQKIKYINHKIRPLETFYSLKNRFRLDKEDILMLNPQLKDKAAFRSGNVIRIPVIEGKTRLKKKHMPIFETIFYTNSPTQDLEVESVAKPEPEAEKEEQLIDYLFGKKEFTFTMMLPLFYDLNDKMMMENKPTVYPKSEYAIQFYTGAKMAIKEWESKGIKVNLHVEDTENSKTKVGQILTKREVRSSDALIGPFYTENVKFASEYLIHSSLPIIAPLSADYTLTRGREHVFQVTPPVRTQAKVCSKYIAKAYGDLPVVIIRRDTMPEFILANNFKSALNFDYTLAENYREKIIDTDKLLELNKSYFTEGQKYVLILASEDRSFVSHSLSVLNKLRNPNLITFTTPSIDAFEFIDRKYLTNLNVHFPKFGKINYDHSEVQEFITNYRNHYGFEPDERFAFLGYDLMNYILMNCKKYGGFKPNRLDAKRLSKISIAFDQPKHIGETFGFQNLGVDIFKFNNLDVQKVYPSH